MHVIGDFILQPGKWIAQRNARHFRTPVLYCHAMVHMVLALLFLWNSGWWLALCIGLGHLIFDGLKSYLRRTDFPAFIIDQSLHAVVILAGVLSLSDVRINDLIGQFRNDPVFWWRIWGYLLVTAMYPKLISFATKQWRQNIPPERELLYKAGRWIGIIERVLDLTFVFIHQYGAIGFFMAAKSVFRFGDLKDGRDKGHTEYVLIGTLLSFGLTILTGLLINRMISTYD